MMCYIITFNGGLFYAFYILWKIFVTCIYSMYMFVINNENIKLIFCTHKVLAGSREPLILTTGKKMWGVS